MIGVKANNVITITIYPYPAERVRHHKHGSTHLVRITEALAIHDDRNIRNLPTTGKLVNIFEQEISSEDDMVGIGNALRRYGDWCKKRKSRVLPQHKLASVSRGKDEILRQRALPVGHRMVCRLDEQQCTEEHCLHRLRKEHGGVPGQCSNLVPRESEGPSTYGDAIGGGFGTTDSDYREA